MTCYHPFSAYQINRGDKPIIIGKKTDNSYLVIRARGHEEMTIPCGQCIGCRLEYSRQWAMRCMHESQMHQDNCFITLTYSPEYLPDDLSLRKDHFQKFMKRLRKRFGTKSCRYYHCGEYGEKFGRPHYHALLFGFDFSDKKLHQKIRGNPIYTSKILEKLWPYGYSSIGAVTFESAAYVARYIMKKQTGEQSDLAYLTPDGVIRQKEYCTMSRRPGIGSTFYEKFHSDIYPKDFITLRGKKMKPPKYYDLKEKQYHEACDELGLELETYHFDQILQNRKSNLHKHLDNNSEARLKVREEVKRSSISKLVRTLD